MEGTIASDSGAMVRDGLKAVARMGVCSELVWPYNIWRFADRPDAPSYAEALLNQVLSYRRLSADLRSMQSCLASGLPFVFGFSVYESFMSDAVMASGVVPMPDYSEQQVGGHAVLAVGYDMARRAFLVRNSWGTGWGLVGYCWMPFDYLSSPDLADDRWSIRLVEQ
jgi:C1A family cysteine protease